MLLLVFHTGSHHTDSVEVAKLWAASAAALETAIDFYWKGPSRVRDR